MVHYVFLLITLSSLCLADTNTWAQTTLANLSLEEKIGQLFIIAAVSDEALNTDFMQEAVYIMHREHVMNMITQYHVGGVIFLGYGTPETQIKRTQEFQALSSMPLLIVQDLEWGLTMRLRNTIRFPRNMTLGAINNDQLIYQVAYEIGRQAHALGVHMNCAPVVDVNNNPQNPIIHDRSFGKDPEVVARKGIAFMRGLHDAGIISCAKHFPGHGDTATDSHYALPYIPHTKERLEAVELYPFKKLIEAGVPAVMTAHLEVPALESRQGIPTSASHNTVTHLLRNTLNFDGLILPDGLGMDGIRKQFVPGVLELRILQAGSDALLCPVDIPKAFETIHQAVVDGTLSEQELDKKVLRVLQAKEWAFSHAQQIDNHATVERIHNPHAYALKKQLYQEAVTLVRDEMHTIPLLTTDRITLIQCGTTQETAFTRTLRNALPMMHCCTQTTALPASTTADTVIVACFGMNKFAQKQFGIAQETLELIHLIHKKEKKLCVVLFGSPYSIALFNDIPGILVAYEDDPDAQEAAAQILLGTLQPRGALAI